MKEITNCGGSSTESRLYTRVTRKISKSTMHLGEDEARQMLQLVSICRYQSIKLQGSFDFFFNENLIIVSKRQSEERKQVTDVAKLQFFSTSKRVS